VQLPVDVADRLGGQAPTVAAAVVEQRTVEGGELGWGEPLERQMPERRDDMRLRVHAVAEPGRRPDAGRPDGREPLVKQEASKGALGRRHEGSLAQAGKCLVERLLALALGPEAALAALLTLARHRGQLEQVPRPGGTALADAPAHQGRSSIEKPSISRRRTVGTNSRRPKTSVGSWPLAAAR
jgi:hypothetical protein